MMISIRTKNIATALRAMVLIATGTGLAQYLLDGTAKGTVPYSLASQSDVTEKAAKENREDPANVLWLLQLAGSANEGPGTKRLLQELSRTKVPTAKDARGIVLGRRLKSGKGVDAQESWGLTGLLRFGPSNYMWIIRSSNFYLGTLIEELWVNAKTGEARVVFPFSESSKE